MNNARILKPRRGSKTTMSTSPKKDIILAKGEFFVEDDTENNIFRIKIGDGTTTYENLSYAFSGSSFDIKFNPADSGLISTNVESALKEIQIEEVDSMFSANGFYGASTTAADVSAKVITISDQGFSLRPGTTIVVKSTNTNTASNVTLNVNSTGAYPIYYSGAQYTGSNPDKCGEAGKNIMYSFDGTYWVWLSSDVNFDSDFVTASEYAQLTPDPSICYFIAPDPVTSQG